MIDDIKIPVKTCVWIRHPVESYAEVILLNTGIINIWHTWHIVLHFYNDFLVGKAVDGTLIVLHTQVERVF